MRLLGITAIGLLASSVAAAPINSLAPTTTGGTFIDFEGQIQGDATSLYTSLGVTFSANAGLPVIDNNPFTFGYLANSGVGVLSINAAPAGIGMQFASAMSSVEFFFNDTAPLGDYVVVALDAGSSVLESFTVTLASIQTNSGRYLGFVRDSADIARLTIVPNDGVDAFALDDLRFSRVPEPGVLALLGLGLAGLAASRRRKQ